MASLKEIKGRISSVEGTLKITSAMKMVASAKLHKAQGAIENMLPYDNQLHKIMMGLLNADTKIFIPLCFPHAEVKRVAIVAIASNSSLCGGYNNNALRRTVDVLKEYKNLPKEAKDVYVIGRKLDQGLSKLKGFNIIKDYLLLGDKPKFSTAKELATKLMEDYAKGRIDKVELVYMHFKSTSTQVPTCETYLPLSVKADNETRVPAGYIIEPSSEVLLNTLIPDALCMKIYTVMLDAQAAEHAARTVAMQTATDNGNDLLDELRILYNKGRQSAITSELLDIIGGSMQ